MLRADDEALLRGRAAFETIRVYGGRPFRLAEHLDRLAGSAERIGLPAREPARARAARAAGARRGRRARTPCCASTGRRRRSSIALVSALADHYDDLRARGQRLISLRGVRADEPWLLPGVKSTSYAVNMAAEAEAKRRGADDAVFVDADGTVLEGPMTNVWWRRERTLFTPSLDLGILAGVTRATVLELAGDAGYDVEEGAFPPDGAAGGGRGVHVLVGARGDAGRRARRRADRARPGGRRAPGRAQAEQPGLRFAHERQDSARRDGAPERRARARADVVGLRDPHRRRRDQGRVGAQAAVRARRSSSRSCAARSGSPSRSRCSRELRRKLPEARLPFERPCVLAATIASAVDRPGRAPRRRDSARAARELARRACSRSRPALLALRGGELAAYHGAEHISIGTYEHGEKRAKEHERCGSHLVGPLLVASAAGNVLAVARAGAPAQAGAGRELDRRGRRRGRGLRAG